MSESETNQIELNIALQETIYIYEDLVENLQHTVDTFVELEKLYIEKEVILSDRIDELEDILRKRDEMSYSIN